MEDPKEAVRRGYDVLSRRYDEVTGADSKYQDWIRELTGRLRSGSRVLDIGCGSGVPAARALSAAGHRVSGVDISDEQPQLFERSTGWLRPGGIFWCTTGHTAWTGTEANWLDGGAPMWWSHTDATTYRTWLTTAGLTIDTETFVPEGDGGHTLFRTHRPTPA